MKIGLLGSSIDTNELLAELQRRGDIEVTCAIQGHPKLRATFPSIELLSHPNDLLARDIADVVFVSGDDNCEEPLRLLARSSMPLVVTHPLVMSIIGFELEMIRADTGTGIVPFSVDTAHSATHAFLKRVREANNPMSQVIVERSLAQPNQSSVEVAFARDATLLRMLIGKVSRLSAMGSIDDGSNLTAQMTTDDGALARWSLIPSTEHGCKVTAVCGEDRYELRTFDDAKSWVVLDSENSAQTFMDWDAADSLLSHFRIAVGQKSHDQIAPTWDQASRGTELAELLEVSARRGRTMKIFNEQHSEESTFKGMMAAGGCLLMMATLLLLPILVCIDALDPPFRKHILWRLWPAYLLAPFAIFLLLQSLKLAFPKPDQDDSKSDAVPAGQPL